MDSNAKTNMGSEAGNDRGATDQQTAQNAVPQKSGKLLKIILCVLLIPTLSFGAYYLTKTYLLPRYQEFKAEKESVEESSRNVKNKKQMGMIYTIKDLTVNTFASRGLRFILMEFAVETHEEQVIEEIKMREPQIRDLTISYLRKYSSEQILDLSFQETSRTDLIELINRRLNTGKIDSLYYLTLVLQ